jgi:hypothetical protein
VFMVGFLLLISLVFCVVFKVGSLLPISLVFCVVFMVGSLLQQDPHHKHNTEN